MVTPFTLSFLVGFNQKGDITIMALDSTDREGSIQFVCLNLWLFRVLSYVFLNNFTLHQAV